MGCDWLEKSEEGKEGQGDSRDGYQSISSVSLSIFNKGQGIGYAYQKDYPIGAIFSEINTWGQFYERPLRGSNL